VGLFEGEFTGDTEAEFEAQPEAFGAAAGAEGGEAVGEVDFIIVGHRDKLGELIESFLLGQSEHTLDIVGVADEAVEVRITHSKDSFGRYLMTGDRFIIHVIK